MCCADSLVQVEAEFGGWGGSVTLYILLTLWQGQVSLCDTLGIPVCWQYTIAAAVTRRQAQLRHTTQTDATTSVGTSMALHAVHLFHFWLYAQETLEYLGNEMRSQMTNVKYPLRQELTSSCVNWRTWNFRRGCRSFTTCYWNLNYRQHSAVLDMTASEVSVSFECSWVISLFHTLYNFNSKSPRCGPLMRVPLTDSKVQSHKSYFRMSSWIKSKRKLVKVQRNESQWEATKPK